MNSNKVNALLDNLDYLETHSKTTIYVIKDDERDKYNNNIYGLFKSLRIESRHHLYILIINGYKSTYDDITSESLIIPEGTVIDEIIKK